MNSIATSRIFSFHVNMLSMKEFILQGSDKDKKLDINYQEELNDEQLAVVQKGDGPTLVLAGAGSGKTRTITYRVAWLLEHGVDPGNILLLTFTNKASKEMIHRVEGLLGRYPQGLWAGTFHSIANRILRTYGNRLGFDSNFSILDIDDAKELIRLCVKELKIDTKDRRFPSASVLLSTISYQRNKKCSMQALLESKHPKFLPMKGEIEQVAQEYAKQKEIQNSMDFDDLLVKLLDILKHHPDILQILSQKFEYVLVDEFQDTNVIQAEIVHLLSSAHQNLLVVGDDAQSIYSFRAAEIQNILKFPNAYANAQTFQLTKNYRSTPEILTVANEAILHNVDQFEKELAPTKQPGKKPSLVPAQSAPQEAQYIAEQILKLHNNGAALHHIAVLFRAAFHSQSLEFELMKRDIPYEYRGGMKFFERAHIKDAVAHLRMINNVKDGMAWVRALKIHPGIGLVGANKIAQIAGTYPSFDEVDMLPVTGKRLQSGWGSFLRVHRELCASKHRASDYIRALSASDEYQFYLENEYPNFRDRLDDLEQFALFAEPFEDLSVFLDAVSLTDEYGAVREEGSEFDEDRLILSTIHQAKGLEWDHVFVMHLCEGSFPNPRALEEERGIEEERRLFYVATTRARRSLFLTYPITAGFEHMEIRQPSMFVTELPSHCYETVTLRKKPSYVQSSARADARDFGEPTIVLDDMGERVKKAPPSSFLSDY
jgi:DNA helicase II / ATP-dependent DNA helicase PcrA